MALHGIGIGTGRATGPVFRMPQPPALTTEPASAPSAAADPSATTDAPPATAVDAPRATADAAIAALATVAAEFRQRAAQITDRASIDVLEATALMAEDPSLHAELRTRTDAGADAQTALAAAIEHFRHLLLAVGGRTAERAADLADLGQRALAVLRGTDPVTIAWPETPFVLVADELAPADAALLDPQRALAVVTATGGPTSHAAIILRSLGIPAVIAVGALGGLDDGVSVRVDAAAGSVEIGAAGEWADAASEPSTDGGRSARDQEPGQLADGTRIHLLANIGGALDARRAIAHGAEGSGLVRTELLVDDPGRVPDRDRQCELYTRVLEAFGDRPVTFRVFDAGADKPLGVLAAPNVAEPNPALGLRGIRALARHPHVLEQQLEALAEAQQATGAPVRVMAPMVADLDEAAGFVERARGYAFDAVGVMVEVPSAVVLAAELATVCDFLSIGTNDLGQYAFAADRQHPALGRYQDPWHPALLRMVRAVADAGSAAGVPVGVCGEAAADPALAVVLAGLGVSSLSMSAIALDAVRAALASVSLDDARRRADAAASATSAAAARAAAR